MSNTIPNQCPKCQSDAIVRNGKKYQGIQNYLCKDCGRQFISDQERTYTKKPLLDNQEPDTED